MKSHCCSFKRFLAMRILYAHILKELSCVFQPASRMMRCYSIACVLPIQRRLDTFGAELCSASMTLEVSIHSISTQNEPFFVKRRSIRFYPLPIQDLCRSGWQV